MRNKDLLKKVEKQGKNRLVVLFVAAMILFSGCSGSSMPIATYYGVYPEEVKSIDYVSTTRTSDKMVVANIVDGLYGYNEKGELVPLLADSFWISEDGKECYVSIRKGMKWVTQEGLEFNEVQSYDFITGLQHAADFNPESVKMFFGVISKLDQYCLGKEHQFGEVDFTAVGIKAVDDYTIRFLLDRPMPYFERMLTYSCLYPVNREFLLKQGEGCQLGNPNPETCSFGTMDPASILYNGPYRITSLNPEEVVLDKNEYYHNASKVETDHVVFSMDHYGDFYDRMYAFEDGNLSSISLPSNWHEDDYSAYRTKYENALQLEGQDETISIFVPNLNRQNYSHTEKSSDAEKENTKKALMDENFRMAFASCIHPGVYWESLTHDQEVANARIKTILSYEMLEPDYAYKNRVLEKLGDTSETDWFSKTSSEITYPVSIDILVPSSLEGTSLLSSMIEENSEGKILVNMVTMGEEEYSHLITNKDPSLLDYDYILLTDINDEDVFVDAYSCMFGKGGTYEHIMGFSFDNLTDENIALMKQSGYEGYEDLVRKTSSAITKEDYYESSSETEAYLLSKGMVVILGQDGIEYTIRYGDTSNQQIGITGLTQYSICGIRTQEIPVAIPSEEKEDDNESSNQ